MLSKSLAGIISGSITKIQIYQKKYAIKPRVKNRTEVKVNENKIACKL